MTARLNLEKVTATMSDRGLSQADLAKKLEVSREAVSKWFKGGSLPRPDKLLRLGLTLGLRAADLLIRDTTPAPVVAFRKKGSAKTTVEHVSRAQQMGALLRPLVPHLPFDRFVKQTSLKDPQSNYDYLQALVGKIRGELGVLPCDPLDFEHLVKQFKDTQTVLVPVLWGKLGSHENALHIFLPESSTTWVFLNLDVEVHDFKFWMAHELGHVLAPELRGNAAEDFADAFGGALLFPETCAADAYASITGKSSAGQQINMLKAIAEQFLISPYGAYVQINEYARARKRPLLKLEAGIHGASKNLSKRYFNVAEAMLGVGDVEPAALIRVASEKLDSPFFDVMAKYVRASGTGPGYLQSVLNIPGLDAIELHRALA
jgi:transcriptional regulator with XRE-family HTH domain